MANPCGFKMKARQLFLFSKKKTSYFLSKESNKQRNNCNEYVEIHYGLLIHSFLPTPNLIAKKKAQPPKRLSQTVNKVFAFIFIHLAKWIENYTIVRSESEYSLEKILSGFIVEFF